MSTGANLSAPPPAVERRQVERGLLPAVLDVRVGRPRLQQGPHGRGVPVLGGAVQGGLLVAVLEKEKRGGGGRGGSTVLREFTG